MNRPEVIQEISPNDGMIRWPPLGRGREQYFELGEEAVQVIQSTLRAVGAGDPRTILDLPCGHGRVLRTLKAAFPQAHLTACDIDHDAVNFCVETFGAEPVYAQPDDVSLGRDFDLIWCGSLLTHLDAERVVAFLELFESRLAPAGLVVFTTSGHCAFRILQRLLSADEASKTEEAVDRQYFPIPEEALADHAAAYEAEGFAYYEVANNFGSSLSSPAWVCKQLERMSSLRLVNYLEQGWGATQDVVACQRAPRSQNELNLLPLMDYCVRDVMTMHRPGPDVPETVLDVARAIAQTAMFTVPIPDPNTGVKGIVGALDIVVSLGRGQDPAATPVDEFTRDVIAIEPGASLAAAKDLLPEHGGIAVVVDDGDVIGFVDLGQIELFMKSVEVLGPDAGHLITEVSPHDTLGAQMSRGSTVAAGVSALGCIRDALGAAGKDGVSSILDFPSGHGRILRVLKAAFPGARLAAGDLNRDAVDFCAQTFGAAPIYSSERPEDITIDDSYDLIWCGSLLTHIDPDRWPGFLSLFRECLTGDGVLVFTASGPRLRDHMILRRFALQPDQAERVLREYDSDGFGYSHYPGSDNYGISLASPDWVREQLRAAGLRVVNYAEVGWDAPAPRQDVIACVRAHRTA